MPLFLFYFLILPLSEQRQNIQEQVVTPKSLISDSAEPHRFSSDTPLRE